MKRGDIADGEVVSVHFPNTGKVQLEDRLCKVKGVILGQKVQVRIKRLSADNCQGMLKNVLEPSPLETVEPVCPHFGSCGGCFYQTLSRDSELEYKAGMIDDLLKDYVDGETVRDDPLGSPDYWEYRNKMEFTFGDEVKGGPLVLGLHKKNSNYDIVYTRGCRIVPGAVSLILEATVDFYREKNVPFYNSYTHTGVLRHLVVRLSHTERKIMVNLVTTTQGECCAGEYAKVMEGLTLPKPWSLSGVLHTANDSLADAVKSDSTELLWGEDRLREQLLGLSFEISPFSFFQTNTAGAKLLYDRVRTYVGNTEDRTVYDLYSGTGTIAQILAPVASDVYGIEIVPEAVEAARANARLNGLENCHFIEGDVLKKLSEIEKAPDVIVVDPPREGLNPGALTRIVNYGVQHIIYVSCKASSLARDLGPITAAGYRMERYGCVDMFPHATGIEVVVMLSRASHPHW